MTKMVIINSILVSSIKHQLMVFFIPTTIANKLDALITQFFWSKKQLHEIGQNKPYCINLATKVV